MNEVLKKKLITALEKKIVNGIRFESVLISEMEQYDWLTPIETANYCSGYLDGRDSFNDEIKELKEVNKIYGDYIHISLWNVQDLLMEIEKLKIDVHTATSLNKGYTEHIKRLQEINQNDRIKNCRD